MTSAPVLRSHPEQDTSDLCEPLSLNCPSKTPQTVCVWSISRKSRDLDALESRELIVVMKVEIVVMVGCGGGECECECQCECECECECLCVRACVRACE